MRIVHKFGFRPSPAQRQRVEQLGLEVPPGIQTPGGGDPLVVVDVGEDHPNFELLQALFRRWGSSGFVRTEFTADEIRTAEWAVLQPQWHHGYPQPDDDFGYLEVTYDLSGYCATCGSGKTQRAPFRMRGEPKWGRRNILQLNWVFDVYFVTPEIWRSAFSPFDIACRPVFSKGGRELESVVQLVSDEIVEVATDELQPQHCSVCARAKYRPVTRGRFPRLTGKSRLPVAATAQQFGSGARTFREVLVARELRESMSRHGVRGASFTPVAADG